jgi:hypothetical protein
MLQSAGMSKDSTLALKFWLFMKIVRTSELH